MSDTNLHPIMQGVFAPHMPEAPPPPSPVFPIENGKALVEGVRWPLDLNAVKTLAADLRREVRLYRQTGEEGKAHLLQQDVLRLDATATELNGGVPCGPNAPSE